MNSTFESDKDNLRYAEYVLGLLDADTRAAVAREIAEHPEAANAVALWHRHVSPLAAELPSEAPSPRVWIEVRRRLGWSDERLREPPRLWDSVSLWRWVGVAATAVATALVVFTVTRPGAPPLTAPVHAELMVATIATDKGVAGWTATMDIERAELVVVPATPPDIGADRDTELWLIPQGAAPISVGVFPVRESRRIPLDKALVARLGPTATLAVSIEPRGGSPSGQPTGPIVAQGAIRAAS